VPPHASRGGGFLAIATGITLAGLFSGDELARIERWTAQQCDRSADTSA
jgi:hypothetical protein